MRLASVVLAFGGCLILAGCGSDETVQPTAIKLPKTAHDVRAGALGSKQRLRFVVSGKKVGTFLGGTETPLVAGARVTLEIVAQPEGAPARLSETNLTTDAGGSVTSFLVLGAKPGVYRVRASLPDHPGVKARTITVLAGVSVKGGDQDGWVGDKRLGESLEVLIEAAPGKGYAGALVEFDLRHGPKGCVLTKKRVVTDKNGVAACDVKLGSKQGKGEIGIRVLTGPWGKTAADYSLPASFLVIDMWGLVIQVLGGLALFIYGMKQMSDGLSLMAGEKLRMLLNILTKNRFAAVGVGLTTTALIQSSSASTVMVIGFVNAGLMRLEQAIGVIMGSNIGTTVTAQMISFKLDKLALPAIAVGVVTLLLAKRSQVRFGAQTLIGFGILFLGMSMMSGPLKELKDSVTLHGLFEGLSCTPIAGDTIPLGGALKAVAAGALLTVIVQSSSASIGLLLALAGAGLVDAYTAFAILMGTNIGTTITAILASIGTTRTAKRAACAHFLFNALGTLIMVALLFISWPGTGNHPVFMELVARLTAGDSFAGENLTRFLANAHTLFNVSCTVAFVGFIPALARICRLIVPGEDPELEDPIARARRFLGPTLLATPSLALQQAWREFSHMLEKSRVACDQGFQAIIGTHDPDWEKLAESIRQHEEDTDALQEALTAYLTEISRETLTEEQSQVLPRLLHAVNDVERIGDRSLHLLRLAQRVRKRSLPFTPAALENMKDAAVTVAQMFELCGKSLKGTPGEVAPGSPLDLDFLRQNFQEIRHLGEKLRRQEHDYRRAHLRRHDQGECDIRSGVIFLDVLVNFDRVGGHLYNITKAATPALAQSV